MLRDELKRLIALFREAGEGKTVNLQEVFGQAIHFFEHLKEQIATGSLEDKQEAMQMMSELYQQMMVESKKIAERSGMTEEQLIQFAENPQNFSPEQWNTFQSSKKQIAAVGKDFVKAVEKDVSGQGAKTGAGKPAKKPSTERKGKKSQWMRS